MKPKNKIILAIMLIIIINSLVFIWFSFAHFNRHIQDETDRQTRSTRTIVSTIAKINTSHYKRRIKALITRLRITNDGAALHALMERQRKELARETISYLNSLQEENPYFASLGFILPSNINFLRVHNQQKFGDDISRMRPDIVAANSDLEQRAGYIASGLGLIYSVVQPIVYKEEHLGLLQFGLSECQLLDTVKDELALPVGLIMASDKAAFITHSKMPTFTSGSFTIRSPDIDFFKGAAGQSDWHLDQQRLTMAGKTYVLAKVLDLRDYNDQVQAQVIVGLDVTKEIAALRWSITLIILTCAVLLVASFLVLHKGYDALSLLLTRKTVELDTERERLAVTLRSIGDGIITTDPSGRVVLINKITEELTGWDQQEATGRAIEEIFTLINKKTGEPCDNPVPQVVASGQIVSMAKHTVLVARDGSRYDIEDSGAPIFDKKGQIIGTIIVFRNVTESRETEKELRMLQTFAEATSQGIGWAASDGTIKYVNPALARLFGEDNPQAPIGNNVATSYYPPEERQRLEEEIFPAVLRKGSWSGELQLKQADGTLIPSQNDLFLIHGEDSSAPLFANFVSDISLQKKMEEELLKMQKLESVGVLAGGIAHDFNNILSAILGNIELAEMETKSSHQAYPLLANAKKAAIRAQGLTQQLLTFAKGGDPIKKTSSIGKIIVDSANFVLHGSPVGCNYTIPADLWPVEVDTGQISQVIQNIVINGSHAMADGGVVEIEGKNVDDISGEPVSLPAGRYVKIAISDSGPGIPARHLDKIFDPYFSTKEKGSGLGLAICHSIINKHGGHIAVDSGPDKGTTFTIFLPATANAAASATPAPGPDPIASAAKATIMIMDDEPMVRELLRMLLSQYGHQVIAAENGHEAIELYNNQRNSDQPIDLIIMDLTIPGGMGGKEAVGEILAINPAAKVVVASGYSTDPVMANYQEYGFMASISKPFQLAELLQLLSKLLG
ncbi:MAG: PAS domain S-box protein [Thermodesulfobacteriota bacterium]